MLEAARITDVTCHQPSLNTGPASPDIYIGDEKAWRALPEDDSRDTCEHRDASRAEFRVATHAVLPQG